MNSGHCVTLICASAIYFLSQSASTSAIACPDGMLLTLFNSNCDRRPRAYAKQLFTSADIQSQGIAIESGDHNQLNADELLILELPSTSSGNMRDDSAWFGVRCGKDLAEIAFLFPGKRMSDHKKFSEIIYRMDNGEEKIMETEIMDNHRSVMGIRENYRAKIYISEAMRSKKLWINAISPESGVLTYIFDMRRVQPDFNEMAYKCGF